MKDVSLTHNFLFGRICYFYKLKLTRFQNYATLYENSFRSTVNFESYFPLKIANVNKIIFKLYFIYKDQHRAKSK